MVEGVDDEDGSIPGPLSINRCRLQATRSNRTRAPTVEYEVLGSRCRYGRSGEWARSGRVSTAPVRVPLRVSDTARVSGFTWIARPPRFVV